MRKIILCLAVTLDGFIEGPNKEIDWIEFTEETGEVLGRFLEEIDTVLYGRVSYEAWGNYSPAENGSDFEKDFYAKLDKMTKFVFSSSKTEFDGNPIVVKSDIKETIENLKQQPGKNIWLYGGAGLLSTFVNLNLVDEFRLAVFPIILGDGNPLFKEIKQRVKLKLLEVKSSESGIVELNYERVNS
jgi:dihydrofolate reductase